MPRHINPRVDIAFKKIFGVEENKDLLMSLINSIVDKEDQVKSITILNPYNPQNFKDDKLSILDIKAEGESGKLFNIEIQISDSADYDKRVLYYWSKLYTEQLSPGDIYSKLNKAIGIHILNFTSIAGSDHYHNKFHVENSKTGVRHFKDLELHTIELNKFDKDIDDDFQKLLSKMKNKIGIWSAFLTKHELLEKRKDELPKDRDLKKALDIINVLNFSKEELDAYEDHLKWLRDVKSAGDKKYADGKAEGKAEGLEKGKAEGIAEGLEKGKVEGLEKGKAHKALEIAKTMISKNYPLSDIASLTGLSLSKLNKLKDLNAK